MGHFLNKYKIMAIRLMSKFDLRRCCKSVGATPLPKMTPPTPEEIGSCDSVYIDELGDTTIVVLKQDAEEAAMATVIIRASTDNIMDDVERAIDDGVNTFKALTRDPQLVPGAGATEIELARRIAQYGETLPGLEQYAVKKIRRGVGSLSHYSCGKRRHQEHGIDRQTLRRTSIRGRRAHGLRRGGRWCCHLRRHEQRHSRSLPRQIVGTQVRYQRRLHSSQGRRDHHGQTRRTEATKE